MYAEHLWKCVPTAFCRESSWWEAMVVAMKMKKDTWESMVWSIKWPRLYLNIIMDPLHKSRTTPHRLCLSSVCSTHCLGDSHLGVVLMSFKRQLATIWNHQQLSWSVLPLGTSLGGCLIASWYKKRQQGPLWEASFPRQGCPYLHKAGEYCVRTSQICLFLSALDCECNVTGCLRPWLHPLSVMDSSLEF